MFDWVIGNPPWKTIDIKNNPKDENALTWIESHADSHPVGDKRIEEAFAWQATEFVAEDGCIGFVLPAKRLFNSKSENFRREFFRQNEVCRITNFSNFHYLLFQADVSAITIIYRKANFARQKRYIWHYSPFVANQVIAQLKRGKVTRPVWAITINKNEIRMISPEEAEKGNALTWKIAFWGSYEDERAFTRLRNTFSQSFGAIIKKKSWELHEGLKLRHKDTTKEPIEAIDDWIFEKYGNNLKIFNPKEFNRIGFRFHVPDKTLEVVPSEWQFVRKGRKIGYKIISSPHAILNAQYAVYSDKNFIIGSQYGITTPDFDADYLKAISVYFSSSICRYLLFFVNPQWGIDITQLTKQDWLGLPTPSFSENQLKNLAELQLYLAVKEKVAKEVIFYK